jgi:hypothetical protein
LHGISSFLQAGQAVTLYLRPPPAQLALTTMRGRGTISF